LVFDLLDPEGTGKLSFNDVKEKFLAKALRRMGHNPTDTEIEQYLNDMDTNSA
jgi:Ca2+-binding EF-hand superfamily protein